MTPDKATRQGIGHPRRSWLLSPLLACVIVPLAGAAESSRRGLSLEERIEAQKAIEQVHYSHQIDATRAFEEAVPHAVLERKVRTYLRQSAALDVFWMSPVTAGMLREELERMAAQTRMPERLEELFAALGNDTFLIQECLARPTLVDRLAREFFAHDATIHAKARQEAEALRESLIAGRLDPRFDRPGRHVVELVRAEASCARQDAGESRHGRSDARDVIELDTGAFDRVGARLPARAGEIGPVEEEPDAFVTRAFLGRTADEIEVAAFVVPKLTWDRWWASVEAGLSEAPAGAVGMEAVPLPVPESDTSRRFSDAGCPHDDTWVASGSLNGILPRRTGHTAVWTGSVMVVWGGGNAPLLSGGARYDPALDTWSPTSTVNAPSGRNRHTAVWTGSVMVVWGGYDGYLLPVMTGGRYDPVTDAWSSTSTSGAPSGRAYHTAVWTGSAMVVWGGLETLVLPMVYSNSGGRYDPATDTWIPTATLNAPASRAYHTAVWTGNLMIVWGGLDRFGLVGTGGRYDPGTDTWTPTSLTSGTPTRRVLHTAVWTGQFMIIWGGGDSFSRNSGARYDPATDTWTPVSTTNSPPRSGHTAVWTGELMVVWGGGNEFGASVDTGGRYDPSSDNWTTTSSMNAPPRRTDHTAVWTGSLMIVWGGSEEETSVATGGLYEAGLAADAFDGDRDGFSVCQGDCDDANHALHPGAWELCDDVDNDCDGTVDGFVTSCGVGECARTGFCGAGVDSCIPGSPSGEICDGLDNDCNWVVDDAPVPSGTPLVAIDQPGQTPVLGWDPLPDASAYDVVVGDLGTILGSGGNFTPAIQFCLAQHFGGNTLDLVGSPVPGAASFYLVRGRNCGGAGSYDSGDPAQVGWRDAEIDASPSSCYEGVCGDDACNGPETCESCAYDCGICAGVTDSR